MDGDAEAFGNLVRKYQDRLFNSMVHQLRNESVAEDVVQEAFLAAFNRLETFQGKSSFYTWLYRIAFNAAITIERRRRPNVSLDAQFEQHSLDVPDTMERPSDNVSRSENVKYFYLALDRLTNEHRAILVLREIDDLSYEEIAETLEMPIGTVRSRLHRARMQLKSELETLGWNADQLSDV